MMDKTTDELLIEATACLVEARQGSTPTPALLQESLEALVQVVGRQDARIAALEAARAPHGPPLEGTGPLPLERKTGVIPGRPGQEVNSGGDTFIPPLRPTPPRKEAR